MTRVYGVGGHPPIRGVVAWGSRHTTVDYPPMTLYALAIIGRAYAAWRPDYRDSMAFTILIKLSIVAMEILLCAAIWKLASPWGDARARLAVLFYWLNPAALMDGAVLGYLDAWAAAAVGLALVAGTKGAAEICGAALMIAIATKLQAIFIVPAAWLLLRGSNTRDPMTRGVVGACAMLAVMLWPFAIRGALPNVVQGVSAVFHHDMLSGTAANLWWIVTWIVRASHATRDLGAWGAWTMTVHILGVSRFVALGYGNPRPIGIALSGAVIVWAYWRAHRTTRFSFGQDGTAVALAAAGLAVHAYFVLAVQVHENHLYLAVPMLAAAAAAVPALRGPLAATSAIFAANLWLFYGFGSGAPLPPRHVTIVDATVVVALLNVIALAWHASRFAAVARIRISAIDSAVPYV